ncbi:MAG: hypothetical protein APG08_00042 [Candidatus Methanofastidiosum methylothiophilum]|jgi:hypothetical protein|uniref:DUF3783 domain-containing protein n=1 Tax=Candidatus Methanofastidiosum methylothiophilum TaxID=1705564 RepID=A0A150JDX0_9EURY|nr:MAG: hypothetical protein AN188_00079 [Candidatus Methanofastidiosum methylthiophilus]MBP6931789.1 DUF3783 domain-containing protein [Methanofastidiosum sp.]OQC50371.1 MAG: hypothetical protein BWX56_01351 [Euryarchaeota archaeon ADurb.Bin023]KYC57575.1 MAG: hypothetical protein APG08_00042 [Candidatus Methanofastidiosum methylthiophilus]KYC57762.1 MAG: hypothetical protein APG09_00902 [Candidatus Methanofastidiosum methylthiophilus]
MNKQKHIVVYGYSESDVLKLKEFIDTKLDVNLQIISASGKENIKVADIIERNENPFFEEKVEKVLMLLDFTDGEIRYLLHNFSTINIPKPLFCALTEHNFEWTFDKLILDLMEERKYFEEKRKSERSC